MNAKEAALICYCSERIVYEDLQFIREDFPSFAMNERGTTEFTMEEFDYYRIMRKVTSETRSKQRGLEAMKYRMYKNHAGQLPSNFGLSSIINRIDTLLNDLSSKK